MATAAPSSTYRTALTTAWVTGVFMAVVTGAMVYQRITADSNDPWKSPQLLALKEQMRAAPKDEKVKEQIRVLDLKFRQRYVRRLAMTQTGGWLLLGGGVVLLVALTTALETRKRLPSPQFDPAAGDRARRERMLARRAVAAAGGLVALGMVAVAYGVRSSIADEPTKGAATAAGGSPAPQAMDLPPQTEFLANWPRFLGPMGNSFAPGAEPPLTWDEKTGVGVAWKAAVPSPGFNSPIVWGDRLFVSGGTKEQRVVLCYETAGGRLLWQRAIEKVPGSPAAAPKVSDQTGFAAPTMVTDGRRAYAIFATGDLAAVNFDGTLAWAKHLGVPKNIYGHATSLAIWQGRVVVQYDQGEAGPANSRLMVFEGATGRLLWEKPRSMSSSWASPVVFEVAGQAQIVTLGLPFIMANALGDGRELWRAELLEGEVTPSPAFAGGLLLAISPHSALLAIRPDGTGDVTESHVSWKAVDGIPDVGSPASNGELVFTADGSGAITCYDLKDGKKVWAHELETEVQATPVIVGKRLYIACTNGMTVVAEVGRAYKELARNSLDEKFYASPAVVGGRIYLRGLNHLYGLAGGGAKPAQP